MSETTPPAAAAGAPIDRIEDLQIEQELQDSYMTYAMSTIMDRALPDVRDGLKPSQRRILVSMRDLNLGPRSKHLKCAKIAGNTSGDYHPHGESIVYPTLVRLAQNWSLRYPLIDGQGNFGSTDGDPPAAMRYTEARPSPVEAELLADLEYDTVNYQPNYDERLMEPTVLPSKFPNLLVNGSTGIAVGMACNLVPHNLREICDAIVKVIDNPDVGNDELLAIVPGPDFPTGGVICGRDGIVDGYTTGRGKMTVRAKLEVETDKKGRSSVIVSELPYGVIRKSIVESVAENVKNDRLHDISAINDESGRQHAVRIVIDLKRDADPEVVMAQLYQYTPCQITVSMINIALVNRQPRTMGLKELIQHFIAHRKDVIIRRTRFLLRKAQQRAHILEGLIFAIFDIDEVIRLIRSSKTREEAIEKLIAQGFRISPNSELVAKLPDRLTLMHPEIFAVEPGAIAPPFRVSRAQAEAIGRLQLIQLVGLEIEKLVSEYKEQADLITEYERILGDEAYLMDLIREDTFEMKEKYGDDRRTEITGDVSGYNREALIAKEEVVVTVSHAGYVKRLPIDTYRSQGRGGRGIKGGEQKEGDFVEHLFVANTHDYLLFFTNQGRVYERRVYDVPEMSRTSQGRSLANLLSFQPGEKIASVLTIKDFEKGEQFLMFATAKGVVKKTILSAYGNINKRGLIAINLREGDQLIDVAITNGDDEILLGTQQGMAIRFKETDVRPKGRDTEGVTGIELSTTSEPEDQSPGPDEVVSMIVIPHGNLNACMVLTGCVNGFGKRTPVDAYRLIKRGGKGVINIKTNDRNGDVVGMKAVCDTDELMMITEKGILMRTPVTEIRETGRNASGVRLLRVDDGDRLVAMAKIDAEDIVDSSIVEGGEEAPPSNGQPPATSTEGTPLTTDEADGDEKPV